MMERLLVVFEGPSPVEESTHEEAWDHWVSTLAALGLGLVADLDPVNVVTVGLGTDHQHTYEMYEAVRL